MLDELERLRTEQSLRLLLAHYQTQGAADRAAWLDRLDRLEGAEPRELVRLHGELLAHGWLEQNTGLTPLLRRGAAPSCYRVTTAGLRALRAVC